MTPPSAPVRSTLAFLHHERETRIAREGEEASRRIAPAPQVDIAASLAEDPEFRAWQSAERLADLVGRSWS